MKKAKYSMNELGKTLDLLNSFMLNEVNRSTIDNCGLESFGIFPYENKIFISLKECNVEKIALFESVVMNSPMLIYQK